MIDPKKVKLDSYEQELEDYFASRPVPPRVSKKRALKLQKIAKNSSKKSNS